MNDISTFKNQNKSLLATTRIHKDALQYKVSLEKISQQSHSSLWTFPTHEKTIEGFCGCNALVTYVYNIRVATFNQSLFEELTQKFFELHEHNINEVFMTLYEQTVSELQLSRLVHSQVSVLLCMVIILIIFFLLEYLLFLL